MNLVDPRGLVNTSATCSCIDMYLISIRSCISISICFTRACITGFAAKAYALVLLPYIIGQAKLN